MSRIIRVTGPGPPQAKAALGPLPGKVNLECSIDEGWVRASTTDEAPQPARRFSARVRVAEVVAEDRGE